MEALAQANGLRYDDVSSYGITKNEITVTAGGSKFGVTSSGNKEHDHDILSVGGTTYLRWQKDPSPDSGTEAGTRTPSRWEAGLDEGDVLAKETLARTPSPPQLADVLSKALTELEKAPSTADTSADGPRSVNGTPALAADTSAGRLLVSKDTPHRVLRLEPYDWHELADELKDGRIPGALPKVTTGPLAAGDGEGMDLTPITGDAVDAMFETLLDYTKALKDAKVSGINFDFDGRGKVQCSTTGCTYAQSFTATVTPRVREERLVDGKVSAVLSATFTVGGRPAGKCASSPKTFRLTGTTASGTLNCTDPSAGAVYSAVSADYRARANARSRANGGGVVHYTIPMEADYLVESVAVAKAEVSRLVDGVKRERDAATCAVPHSFPAGTQVLLADGTHRPIEDIRVGDRVTTTDPTRGLTEGRPVTNVITTADDKNFTRITVTTDAGPATITATDNHPFWLTAGKRWTDAGTIRPGDELRSPAGTPLRVSDVLHEQAQQRTHDLTVSELHTYYVLAGQTPVLVHNSNCWTVKARMRAAGPGEGFGLPNQGRIRYVPPKGYNPANPLPRGRNGGYVDRFGNEWTVGPSRTEGHPFEWDVQLSRQGREKIGWLSRDNRHVNVDPFGEVTHR
ncbi:polymorphic toxin type 17 domain-containing protein [Streptomyces sp. NPDC059409]|uniref:polymorphic toxin type 17 domain-containing protein n=1 Tax=Streptomyces sp. NPDC059409 TaxID=3346824 RepID=UPI0036749AE6